MYKPVIYQLPKQTDDILKHKEDAIFTRGIEYPQFRYGFNHFIYSNKKKMEITEKIKMKRKKFYYVTNPFEHKVDNYDKDLQKVAPTYLGLQGKPQILSRAFYKLWEIFCMFDLVPLNEKKFVSAHLAEGPGSFIQATMHYREKYANKLSKQDKYFGITLHSENKDVPELESKFTSYYAKEKPRRFHLHKTVSKAEAAKSPNKDNGDLTQIKTIRNFEKEVSKVKYADLVTADGGCPWKDENMQEQECYNLILGQMVAGLRIQNTNGNYVLKVFESFTDVTIKMILALQTFYDNVYLVKPYTSRMSNSEKYLVCEGFKYDRGNKKDMKEFEQRIVKLESILEKMNKSSGQIENIFSTFEVNNDTEVVFTKSNTEIADAQYIAINRIISYIEGKNYFGDRYHNYRNEQIKASEFWIKTYFTDSKTSVQKNTLDVLNLNKKEVNNFYERLIMKRKRGEDNDTTVSYSSK